MKSTTTPVQQTEVVYPRLRRCINRGYVVLFVSENSGVVVFANPDFRWPVVGHHSTGWVSATDSTTWEDFTGTIHLTN